jgi:cytochrome c553
MLKTTLPLALAIMVLVTGCSNLDRSRNLNDPRVSGKTIAQQVCSICHGIDGNSVSPQFPRLAGQQKDYITAQLKNFRSHNRSDPPGPEMMWGLSRSLTDAQIEGIAEYFNRQVAASSTTAKAAHVSGKAIYENGLPDKEVPPCSGCHGPQAQGLASFPRLAGQHENYLVRQLHVFQETEFRPGTPMKQITHALTAQQIEEVAAYLAAFPTANQAK